LQDQKNSGQYIKSKGTKNDPSLLLLFLRAHPFIPLRPGLFQCLPILQSLPQNPVKS
jgi:hypothetical protein